MTFKNSEQEILKISTKTRNKLNSRIHDDFSLQEYKDLRNSVTKTYNSIFYK